MSEGAECAKAGTEAGPWRRAGEGRARKQSRKAAEMASQPDESPQSPVPSPPTAAAAASLNALACPNAAADGSIFDDMFKSFLPAAYQSPPKKPRPAMHPQPRDSPLRFAQSPQPPPPPPSPPAPPPPPPAQQPPPPPPSASSSCKMELLAAGARVEVRGLENNTDLNGKRGVVVVFGMGAAGRVFSLPTYVPYSAQQLSGG